mmetsp:Transcript_17570/g.27369  ORF Transcript_17570/g.27369 Transcript_17570/m.27369 type:complete len:241 (+) Transcript_17570:127-849(+)|eukprot:CAMPEP_0196807900 /NCGR_PEP_ID=MMETSP1362-20130617/7875_1 /TAXON_ID=163516 /ORGANISM="Leptocylindrus danicus, Strain CCMP1856" /LENGTH=240 /DNA_ID=CAMNT_0042182001 /DNA_START=57 /DNA_END=779 /DNA_ORIENTATION=-
MGCSGEATSCSNFAYKSSCRNQDGCSYSIYRERCSGSAYSCDNFNSDQSLCEDQSGCSWNGGGGGEDDVAGIVIGTLFCLIIVGSSVFLGLYFAGLLPLQIAWLDELKNWVVAVCKTSCSSSGCCACCNANKAPAVHNKTVEATSTSTIAGEKLSCDTLAVYDHAGSAAVPSSTSNQQSMHNDFAEQKHGSTSNYHDPSDGTVVKTVTQIGVDGSKTVETHTKMPDGSMVIVTTVVEEVA